MAAFRRVLPAVLISAALAAGLTCPAQISSKKPDQPSIPDDPIKAALDRSKEEYKKRIGVVTKEVMANLDLRIAAARKEKGNKAKVDTLIAQKNDFKDDENKLPPVLGKNGLSFARRIKAAQADLDKAYSQAVRDYTSNGKDDLANAVKSEQDEWRPKTAAVAAYQRQTEGPVDAPVANGPAPPPPNVSPTLLVSSAWNFTRRRGGIGQDGAFRIVDGVIYHLNADNPVGAADLDGDGRLHLSFQGHRKIATGEAVVEKVAPGQWRGFLNFAGSEWKFELSRR